ncbi:hypothetical protein [Sinorhizobium sp. BJ1]|uniref:hypothetical protein n=1 Tax=Sinorhizobium sp. BJ1 TaxID=2035455 RepID=UPI000BE82BFD|nr:hypothetical protein [Sinorhizobium sp. BJ1]PDT81738.1 hypothetical protein CO676_20915 [Sinorhizobium sp. BJ1]
MKAQASVKQTTERWQDEAADRQDIEALLGLDVLSGSERLALLSLMRRGIPHFSKWSDDVQGLFRKSVVFPIDDNHEVYAVRANIWAAREQYMTAHKDKKTPSDMCIEAACKR